MLHVSNLSVRNFRSFLLMYPGSVTALASAPPPPPPTAPLPVAVAVTPPVAVAVTMAVAVAVEMGGDWFFSGAVEELRV